MKIRTNLRAGILVGGRCGGRCGGGDYDVGGTLTTAQA